jgi:hypothetical protein
LLFELVEPKVLVVDVVVVLCDHFCCVLLCVLLGNAFERKQKKDFNFLGFGVSYADLDALRFSASTALL